MVQYMLEKEGPRKRREGFVRVPLKACSREKKIIFQGQRGGEEREQRVSQKTSRNANYRVGVLLCTLKRRSRSAGV